VEGSCEHGIEPLGSIQFWEILEWLHNWLSSVSKQARPIMVLRRIFGPKRDAVTGGWRKLHNEELYNLYSSPSIIRMMKSRGMRWVGHVARMR
jgi:hypothetical protein